jgi:hypothetical protein
MLLVTDTGHYFTVVEDFDDPTVLWARSQDRRSIEHAQEVIGHLGARVPQVVNQPTWDYQFRLRLSRAEWALYLEYVALEETTAHKLKPAVAEARGKLHPVARMVEEVFYYMSYNRPDRSKPGWISGKPRART